LVNSII